MAITARTANLENSGPARLSEAAHRDEAAKIQGIAPQAVPNTAVGAHRNKRTESLVLNPEAIKKMPQ